MRASIRILAPALLTAGLVLTACSDEVSGSASPAETPTTSATNTATNTATTSDAPSGGGGGAEVEQFCTDGEQLFGEVGDALDNAQGMGPAALADALQQVVDAFDALEPPDEIADDWAASQAGFADLRDAVAAIDPAAPDAAQRADDVLDSGETTVGPAFQRVSDWIDQNCDNA